MNFDNCIAVIVRFFYKFLVRKVIRENHWRAKTTFTADNFFYSMVRATTDLHTKYSQVYINMTHYLSSDYFFKAIVWLYENCKICCGQTTSNE